MTGKPERGGLPNSDCANPGMQFRSEAEPQLIRAGSANSRDSSYDIGRDFEIGTLTDVLVALESFVAKLSNPEDIKNAVKILPSALRQSERLGVRRSDLADACHVSEATISRWTSGQSTPMFIVARAALDELRTLIVKEITAVQSRISDIRYERALAQR